MALAATSVLFGILWDISWHTTIGRDTFWTPAHLAIYLGGVIAGCTGGFLVLRTTLAGTPAEKSAAVSVWGMRGPYGAWIAIWGAFAMITSAPFDNWWHNAYGLDVEILSPPHTVLAVGIMAICYGAAVMVLSLQNRSDGADDFSLRVTYVYLSGVCVAFVAIFISEYTYPNLQHGGRFYVIASLLFPLSLTSFARGSKLRWPATSIAACYMGLFVLVSWTLEQFPATPKLAPIYTPLDHLAPFQFPLLLIVPAFAIDLMSRRLRDRSDTLLAAIVAVVFFVTLLATQWFFSIFLLSHFGRNGIFFGDRIWPYFSRPGSWKTTFWNVGSDPLSPKMIAFALAIGFLSARIGIWRGNWMRKVMR